MHLLILGGSKNNPGGVEAFCDRATEAMQTIGEWRVTRSMTSTAHLDYKGFPAFFHGLRALIAMRRAPPDCVWLQYHNLPDLAYLAVAKMMGLPVVITPHLGANWRSQSDPILRWLSHVALRPADQLALISPTQEQEISLPDSVPRTLIRTFLPRQVLTQTLPEASDNDPTMRILHSGRLSVGKGTFLTVDVCAALHEAKVPFSAKIIGAADPATYAALRDKIAGYGLESQIEVIEWLPVETLLDHMKRADVLVHLSRIDSFPLIVLEAMASGMVPVCLELAGARSMVDTYGGHIVQEEDSVGEAARWLAAQDLADLRARGSAMAVRVRADYDWTICIAALATALAGFTPDDQAVLPAADTARIS